MTPPNSAAGRAREKLGKTILAYVDDINAATQIALAADEYAESVRAEAVAGTPPDHAAFVELRSRGFAHLREQLQGRAAPPPRTDGTEGLAKARETLLWFAARQWSLLLRGEQSMRPWIKRSQEALDGAAAIARALAAADATEVQAAREGLEANLESFARGEDGAALFRVALDAYASAVRAAAVAAQAGETGDLPSGKAIRALRSIPKALRDGYHAQLESALRHSLEEGKAIGRAEAAAELTDARTAKDSARRACAAAEAELAAAREALERYDAWFEQEIAAAKADYEPSAAIEHLAAARRALAGGAPQGSQPVTPPAGAS